MNFDYDAIYHGMRVYCEIAEYKGDAYWAEHLRDECGSPEKAIRKAKSRAFLEATIKAHGLEAILVDKHATEGLKEALFDYDQAILKALRERFEPEKRRPGRRPTENGLFRYEIIAKYDADGLSNREIAKKVYKDPTKDNLVAAHLAQVRPRGKRNNPKTQV
jgi:hypothetical protein